MVRILQVVTYMGRGGLETMLMNYYRNINRDKVQFDFLVHRDFRADYDDEIEELGGVIYRLPVLNPFGKEYRSRLNEFFEQHPEYEIVHVHQDCMSSLILKVAKQHGVPVRIAHSHNSKQEKNLKLLIKLFYKRLIPKYSTDLMACSQEAGEWMFGNHKFQVVRNAIDAISYIPNEVVRGRIRKQYQVGDEFLIGHVGRFSYQKNHDFLIDIFEALQKKQSAKLLLIGGKSLRSEDENLLEMIRAKVKALGLEDKVIFAGICSNVTELMQGMDVFVFPSHYEGLPVTLVEAQAAGLPCIISDSVSSDSVLTDRVTQVPLPKSADEWADIIIHEAQKGKKNTLQQIRAAGFDIKENASRLETWYLSKAAEEREVCLF